jgi:RNA polymerase sigma-70 factor (ECF subfamily)
MTDGAAAEFTSFVKSTGPRLKQALIAALGGEAGREATSEALTWAWEHWDQVATMSNPAGYLYRLGRNRGITSFRKRRTVGPMREAISDDQLFEPRLAPALARLSENQRMAVLLIHGFGWTYREVAAHLGIAVGSVQTHVDRGMSKLRRDLRVEIDA